MGRRKKFSNSELKKIAEDAVERIINGYRYTPVITPAMIYRNASRFEPNLAESDCYKQIVKDVIDEYEKNVRKVFGKRPSEMKKMLDTEEVFEARVFINEFVDEKGFVVNRDAFEKAFVDWGEQYHNALRKEYQLSVEITGIREAMQDSSLGVDRLRDENESLKKQIEKLTTEKDSIKNELMKYKEEFDELERLAGLLVIKDCKMATIDISTEDENRVKVAKQLTYLKEVEKEKSNERNLRILEKRSKPKEET